MAVAGEVRQHPRSCSVQDAAPASHGLPQAASHRTLTVRHAVTAAITCKNRAILFLPGRGTTAYVRPGTASTPRLLDRNSPIHQQRSGSGTRRLQPCFPVSHSCALLPCFFFILLFSSQSKHHDKIFSSLRLTKLLIDRLNEIITLVCIFSISRSS